MQGIPLVPGRTLELCIAKNWSSLGESVGIYTLRFCGVMPIPTELTLVRFLSNLMMTKTETFQLSSESISQFALTNALDYYEIRPRISMRHLCQPVRPIEVRLEPLTPRDRFQDDIQIYRILLTYEFRGEWCLWGFSSRCFFQFTSRQMYILICQD